MTTQPLKSRIQNIELINFAGDKVIDIAPQVFQLEFYESLFQPLQKVMLTMYDPIGLFNNFPLLGEEFVVITFEKNVSENQNGESVTFGFCIDSIRNITPSTKNREQTYTIELVSIPAIVDAMINVQHAYNGPISKVLTDMFNQYVIGNLNVLLQKSGGLKKTLDKISGGNLSGGVPILSGATPSQIKNYELNPDNIEESLGDDAGTIIIPNLKPFTAAQFLAQRATPKTTDKSYYYLFWQAGDGFHFQTLQNRLRQQSKKEFIYYSDNAIVNKLGEAAKNNAITNLVINNRITTLEKISGGYFQNGYFEINLAQLRYKVTDSTLKDNYTQTIGTFSAREDRDPGKSLTNKTNTDEYIDAVAYDSNTHTNQSSIESKNRMKYSFNNRYDTDKITPLMNRDLVWGNAARTRIAFDQIDLHITVPGDFSLVAGDIITVRLPKFEGFNIGDGNTDDKLIVGRYLITDVKHVFFTVGSVHSTVLRINKDAHNIDPNSVEYAYGDVGGSR
jgi:hypothetical protein